MWRQLRHLSRIGPGLAAAPLFIHVDIADTRKSQRFVACDPGLFAKGSDSTKNATMPTTKAALFRNFTEAKAKAAPLVKVATCNLNCWAMDFKGNLERIKESIREAKEAGCTFRTGPELEITGYGCEDGFLEYDTFHHSWESLVTLLAEGHTDGILCDIGMPVMHRNVPYNCRVWALNGKILGIRPKMWMANDGNYRELRYFVPWHVDEKHSAFGELEDFYLPGIAREKLGQEKVPIGIFAVATNDTCLATETCEELFTPNAPHIKLGLDGVEIFANGSGSHHQLRKLDKRIDLLRGVTSKVGGVYLYANMKGCDGGRLYFDGSCAIFNNGSCVGQGSQFLGLDEVEVVTAVVNLAETRSSRSNFIARAHQASKATTVPRVEVDFNLCSSTPLEEVQSLPRPVHFHTPMEEIAYGPSGWLWDYLRRSGQRGYFLPLSGGADSASTACLVSFMCQRVVWELKHGSERSKAKIKEDVQKMTRRPGYVPETHQDLANKIFSTCYMASLNSGDETRQRAEDLAACIGANHASIYIDGVTEGIRSSFKHAQFHNENIDPSKVKDVIHTSQVKTNPQWFATVPEDLALQNIQARSRMVMAYYMAQLMAWSTGTGPTASGNFLVLGSANVDEALRGYYTKYDCSAADVNPIGGINKRDLKDFLKWAAEPHDGLDGIAVLKAVAEATPTAELRPDANAKGGSVPLTNLITDVQLKIEADKKAAPLGDKPEQSDEVDMGMSYQELGDLGYLRKVEHCGPLGTYLRLRQMWAHKTGDWKSPADNDTAITPVGPNRVWACPGRKQPEEFEAKVAQKVKDFFFWHVVNRHKMTTLTPSYHAENYSPDDNRFDLRPFLCPTSFDAQFAAIDALVEEARKK